MSGKLKLTITLLIIPFFMPMQVFATTVYNSSNYGATQVFFGSGGADNLGSANYSAQASAGDLGVGNTSSADYQAYAGFNTTSQPFLEFVVTSSNIDLGYLSKTSTATANGSFYVRAWQSRGYSVVTASPPPTYGNHSLATPATPTSSAVGTEQFGMNLVANTSPVTFGANPQQTTSYAFGSAFGNYAVANKFAYNQNDIVAQSTSSSSSTIYTISYIFNISGTTIGGQYVFNQDLVATSTY